MRFAAIAVAVVLGGCAEGDATVVPVPIAAVCSVPTYDRAIWHPRWIDADGDCQTTRHEVLLAESLAVPVMDDKGCRIISGMWIDPYTGQTIRDASLLDIDHMVPLKNAHDSGGWLWSTEMKRRFANDLGDDFSLTAVSQSANRSKGDRGPDQWLPPKADFRCEYAARWLSVKERWGLSLTPAEARSIAGLHCPNVVVSP